MQRKALAGLVLVIVSLILIFMAMTMPWYSIKVEASSMGISMDTEMNYHLDRFEMSFLNETQTMNYDEVGNESAESIDVFKTTQLMVYMGLVGCIVGIIGAALVMVEKMSAKVGTLLVVIALILAVLAPIYIMLMLPGAFEKDFEEAGGTSGVLPSGITQSFFGSERTESDEGEFTLVTEYSWGGGMGWILTLIAVILLIVAMALVGRAKAAPVIQPEPQPQQAYQQPAAQAPPASPQKAPPPRRSTPPAKPAQPPPSKPSQPPPSDPTPPPPPPPP